jgi:hypothetical protein
MSNDHFSSTCLKSALISECWYFCQVEAVYGVSIKVYSHVSNVVISNCIISHNVCLYVLLINKVRGLERNSTHNV